jgi:hypothetical protein
MKRLRVLAVVLLMATWDNDNYILFVFWRRGLGAVLGQLLSHDRRPASHALRYSILANYIVRHLD